MDESKPIQVIPASRMLAARTSAGTGQTIAQTELLADAEAVLASLADGYPDILAGVAREMAGIIDAGGGEGGALDYDTLLRLAHDVKGQAGSVGYAMASEVAWSLCRVIQTQRHPWPGPGLRMILGAHVQALMAIARNRCRGDGGGIGREIVDALRGLEAILPPPASPPRG